MLDTLFAFNQAESSGDVLRAIREMQGVAWWSVLAADADGQAMWSQIQVLANVPYEHAETCSTEFGRAYFAASRTPMLDGSRSECGWRSDTDAVEPGIFGPGSLEHPQLALRPEHGLPRNSNGRHWLRSANVRIDGTPLLVGDEASELSLRKRGVIAALEEALAREPLSRSMVKIWCSRIGATAQTSCSTPPSRAAVLSREAAPRGRTANPSTYGMPAKRWRAGIVTWAPTAGALCCSVATGCARSRRRACRGSLPMARAVRRERPGEHAVHARRHGAVR